MKKFLVFVFGVSLTIVAQAAPSASVLQQKIHQLVATQHFKGPGNPATKNKKIAAQYRQTLFERFLQYVTYNSASSYTEEITPGQIETAQKLFQEIKAMGYTDAELSEHHYIFVRIPSNLSKGQTAPVLGFSGHYDVTPQVESVNVNARVIEQYDGSVLSLGTNPKGEVQILDPNSERDAYLKTQIGNKIVTSDGKTNLGADDRAGLSILMTTLQVLAEHPEKKHGEIQIIIAPNEETGGSAKYIDQTPFRPEISFDFDGGVDGELMVRNFNALQIICTVNGAKGFPALQSSYINAVTPASDLVVRVYKDSSLPVLYHAENNSIVNLQSEQGHWMRLPSASQHQQGYLDVYMESSITDFDEIKIDFRVRSFNKTDLLQIEKLIYETAVEVAHSWAVRDPYGGDILREPTITCVTPVPTYCNIGECAHPGSMQVASAAFEAAGVKMNPTDIRAGTTGATFVPKGLIGSFMLFTGQNNVHSYAEWLSEEDMYKSFLVGLNIIDQVVEQLGNNN